MTYSGVIGNNGGLPWPHNKADMGFFKSETIGKAIIMGRKTYDSIGYPLGKRINAVITTDKNFSRDGICVYTNIDKCLRTYRQGYIIGGSNVYKYALEAHHDTRLFEIGLLSEIIVTWFEKDYTGDIYFPVSKSQIDENSEEEIVEYFDDDITIVRYKLKPDYRFSV